MQTQKTTKSKTLQKLGKDAKTSSWFEFLWQIPFVNIAIEYICAIYLHLSGNYYVDWQDPTPIHLWNKNDNNYNESDDNNVNKKEK